MTTRREKSYTFHHLKETDTIEKADFSWAFAEAWNKPVILYSNRRYVTIWLETYWTHEGEKCDLEEYDNNANLVFKDTLTLEAANFYLREML